METTKPANELHNDSSLTPQLKEFIRSFLVPLLVKRYLDKLRVEAKGQLVLPEEDD